MSIYIGAHPNLIILGTTFSTNKLLNSVKISIILMFMSDSMLKLILYQRPSCDIFKVI